MVWCKTILHVLLMSATIYLTLFRFMINILIILIIGENVYLDWKFFSLFYCKICFSKQT